MPDRPTPTPTATTAANGAELPPRLLAKLKIEVEGYEIIERIGEGGQATVYKAFQKKDGRIVAIKILHAGPHATDEARARLKRETAALRALNHPNIVHALAAGRTRSGLDCLVMNYIDGRPLDALWEDDAFAAAVAPEPPPAPAARLKLFKTICETVQAAHRKGITHRDLSPSNILIDKQGQPHILDFGMASTAFDALVGGGRNVTVTGQFIGKLKYASPEQAKGAGGARGENADIRSDVYALGVMLYQLLTGGAFPYEVVGNVIDVLHNIIHSQPKPPSQVVGGTGVPPVVPGGAGVSPAKKGSLPVRRNPPLVNETIEAIVLKALEKDPANRYQSAGELAADIDRYLAGQPTSATAWSARSQASRKPIHLRRALVVAASVTLIATLVGVTMNAKALAVWFGLVTAAAPVLPSDFSPIDTAQAAAQPGGPASVKGLNTLAEDLALVESKLRAVNAQLDALNGRTTEGSSGPMDLEAFCAKISAASEAAGNTIKFDLMSKEDRAQRDRAEADKIKGETDKDTLLSMRRDLDAQQTALWAQLTWGAVTSRNLDTKSLYKYRLKSPAMVGGGAGAGGGDKADPAANDKRRFLDDGVKAFRTIDVVLRDGSATLKSAGGGLDGGPADTKTMLSDASTRMLDALVGFQRTANTAADSAGMTEDDRKAIDTLKRAAGSVVESMNEVVEAQSRLAKSDDDAARALQRRRLQQNLLDAAEAAARLDDRLVAVSKDWKADFTNEKLGPVVAVAAKPKAEPQRPNPKQGQPQGLAALFPIDSRWSGSMTDLDSRSDFGFNGTVTQVSGTSATIQYTNTWGRWEMQVGLHNGRLAVLNTRELEVFKGPRDNHFENIRIDGPMPGGGALVDLTGTWTVIRSLSNKRENFRTRFVIRNDAPAKPAIDIAKMVRGTWSGTKGQTSTPVNGNGRQDVRNDQILRATLSRRGNGSLELETVSADGTGRNHYILQVQGDKISLDEGSCYYTGPSPRSFSNVRGNGTISESSIQFDFSFLCTPKNGVGAHTATASMTLTKDQ